MKTLYLTDLDGTLLNDSGVISEKSVKILNELLAEDVCFTVSTARTYATVIPMFKDVHLKFPLVLMNGVCIYDPVKRKTLSCCSVSLSVIQKVLSVFREFNVMPMVYFEKDSKLRVEYISLYNKAQSDYVNSRINFYNKNFVQVENFSLSETSLPVYAVYLDKKERVEPIFEKLKGIREISCNFYPDNYTGNYFLELFCAGFSKLSGAMKVKETLGCDKIVAFGDNLNDIPLLKAADEGYAVSNACDEVKRHASGVIGKNSEDAVALFLQKRFSDGFINQ